jgi:hypothetical protein
MTDCHTGREEEREGGGVGGKGGIVEGKGG